MATAVTMTVSSVVTGWIVKSGSKLGIMDDPKKHKHPKVVHDTPVPRGGGIPILLALLVGSVLFMPLTKKLVGLIVGAVILGIVGWLDDRHEEKISPYLRLFLNCLAGLAVIGVGIGIAYVTNPLGGIIRLDLPQYCFNLWGGEHCIWILADLLALGWLIWMQNIVGWSSGVDGQLPGFVIIAALTIGILGLRSGADVSQWPVVIMSGIVAGSYLGFLPWNWFPQKIMPGYGGKSLAGFLLGVLAIMSGAKVGAMMLVLGVPTVDAILVMIKRINEKRSPVWGGKEHLHHYLLEAGWTKKKIAIFYWTISFVMAVFALRLNSGSKYFTMAATTLVVGGLIVWFHYFSTYLKHPGQDSG
jgi:UDP-GlcNAc:undecaprenyl-phosphate GlcNAc-1-phosphate transferase